MFLGYQNDKIVLAMNTREEIENVPLIELTKIEETNEEYVLWKGEFVLKKEACWNKEDIRNQRRKKYSEETDKFLLENLENVSDIDALLKLISSWKEKKDKIRQELKYA